MREQNLNPVKVMSSGYEGPQMSFYWGYLVPNIEEDSILLLGYGILYKEYNLIGFSRKKKLFKCECSGITTTPSLQLLLFLLLLPGLPGLLLRLLPVQLHCNTTAEVLRQLLLPKRSSKTVILVKSIFSSLLIALVVRLDSCF